MQIMQKNVDFDLSLSPESIPAPICKALYNQIVSSYILHSAEWNVDKNDHRKPQYAIAESLKEFGMLQQLIIEPHPTIPDEYRIMGGNHWLLKYKGKYGAI